MRAPVLPVLCLGTALSLLTCGCGRLGFDLLGSLSPAEGHDASADDPTSPADAATAADASPDAKPSDNDAAPGTGDGGRADGGRGDGGLGDGGPGDGGPLDQRLRIGALPYAGSDALWARVTAGAPSVAISVLNPNSGVGLSRDTAFAQRTSDAQAQGIEVLGYVTTLYTARSLAEVEAEIDQYESWYAVDGYFLDQSTTGCGDQSYYQTLYDHIKAKSPGLRVVLDPGVSVPECYAASADTLVTFQNTLSAYEDFAPQAWEAAYPRELFWHLVYAASAIDDMEHAFDLAAQRRVGFIFVTNDDQPDPWDTLPGDAYWSAELARAMP